MSGWIVVKILYKDLNTRKIPLATKTIGINLFNGVLGPMIKDGVVIEEQAFTTVDVIKAHSIENFVIDMQRVSHH